MKKYIIMGLILTMLVCTAIGCTRLTNLSSLEDTSTAETTAPESDAAATTTVEPEIGTLENPVGLNETFFNEYSEHSNPPKHYIKELTLTEVIRGQAASDLINQATEYPLREATENEEYILLKFHVGVVEVENFLNPLGFYSMDIVLEDGTCIRSYSSKRVEDFLNMRYYSDVKFATPGSTDVYALFIVPKNQAKLVIYSDNPKIYFSLE